MEKAAPEIVLSFLNQQAIMDLEMMRFQGLRSLLGLAATVALASHAADSDTKRDGEAPEFTFLRLIYSSTDWRGASWAIDYPKADIQFIYGLQKLSDFTFVGSENRALPIEDPELFSYPFVYAVEVGHMSLSDSEAATLREYLKRGGFLVVDDFHGPYEWQNFYLQIKKVFPEYEPFDLPFEHPIFHCYFDIEELFQVPGLQYAHTGRTWEKGGYRARYMGIEDDTGRLMVMINHNVDLGDAWEWAEREEYPRRFANLAFQLGINYIVYAMTH